MADQPNEFDWEQAEADLSHQPAASVPGQRQPVDDRDAESVELVPTRMGGPVDRPDLRRPLYAAVTGLGDARRPPVVPAWLRSRDQVREMGRWALRYTGYVSAFHAVRLPKYLFKALFWSVRGAAKLSWRQICWWWLLEVRPMQQQAAYAADNKTWQELHQTALKVRTWRGLVLLAEAIGLGVALILLVVMGAWWVQALAAAVTVPVLARAGRPLDRPILDRVSPKNKFIKLTGDQVRAGLVATGKVKTPEDVAFAHDIGRDGPGWLAQVILPPGVVDTDILDQRKQLAGGLRLPTDQVWPDPVRGEHPGRLNIWVADRPVNAMKKPEWPLLHEGTTDYFQPIPYGSDVRVRPIEWRLAERNDVFGGVPGSGKSLAARNVLLGAVLDPLVIPAVSELKGTGDWECFQPLCPEGLYISGADEGAIDQTIAMAEWLLSECERRPALIGQYAKQGLNTTRKLNRAMAERDPRLRPIVAVFDEVQEAITAGKKGKRFAAMLTSIVKRGRALGIHLILATQRLDKESLPKGITSNITNRAALAVPTHVETDLILGTSAYKTGARPTMFVPGEDSGWMVRVGFVPGHETVYATFIDDPAALKICQRALQLRQGNDAPEPVRVQARSLLADVRDVWPTGEQALWSVEIIGLLQELDPDAYADMTPEIFGAQMAAAGVPTKDIGKRIDGKQATRKGVRLDALTAGIAAREEAIEDSLETDD